METVDDCPQLDQPSLPLAPTIPPSCRGVSDVIEIKFKNE